MSGIYISGMEMPNPGQIVLVEIDENGDVFAAYDGGRTKLVQHKAIPVPPHGRCIDADAFSSEHKSLKMLKDVGLRRFNWHIAAAAFVDDAPTIIPADKED